MKKRMGLLIPLILLLSLLSCGSAKNSLQMGVNYGQLGDDLLSPTRSVQLLRSMGAQRVKIYDANHQILRSLRGTGLQVSVMLPNELIEAVAAESAAADRWVFTNLVPFYPETRIRYLLVGNEITSIPDDRIRLALVPAIQRIRKSLVIHGLRKIKVGTSVAMDALQSSFPPSNGSFRSDLSDPVLKPLLRFLNRTRSFFFIDVYTYFPWSSDPTHIDLNYALLEPTHVTYTDPGSGFTYTNLLDQMLDAVHFAMCRAGFPGVRIAIAETGWPNAGDFDQIGANVHNAATYNRNAVRRLMGRVGTPARKEPIVVVFVFSLYNENQKPGPSTERHFGLRYPDGSPVYDIDLAGKKRESDYGPLPKPTNDKPYKGRIWCVAAKDANRTALAAALSWACGQGNGTCDPIQPKKECGGLDLLGRASFAFSSYWEQFRSSGGTCYFTGLAVQTIKDPSCGSCNFPSVVLQ